MMEALAYAKVNLGLRVGGRREDGYHPLHGVFQSVDWADRLRLVVADVDGIRGPGDGPVIAGEDNLAWQAVRAVRTRAGVERPLRLELDKQIPVAAGLGGGSSDAAAALGLAGEVLGVERSVLVEIAPELGSDVPFCFVGGTALVGGRGEAVVPLEPLRGFALVIVVPPIELATSQVFTRWDEMGEPSGPPIAAAALPPPLRAHAPLVNDLYPAAVGLAPAVDEWRRELATRWGRPVIMSGSGPSLYSFFVDVDEATSAIGAVPVGGRAVSACRPIPRGWELQSG